MGLSFHVPFPSSPCSFLPQYLTPPDTVTAQVWLRPAVIETARLEISGVGVRVLVGGFVYSTPGRAGTGVTVFVAVGEVDAGIPSPS
jgi:hypothetical protein